MKKSVTQIGLLGFGTVGKAVFDLLKKNKTLLVQKMIPEISVKKICVKDLKKDRDQALEYKELEKNIERNKATRVHLMLKEKGDELEGVEKKYVELEKEIGDIQKEISQSKKEIQEKRREIEVINTELNEKGDKRQRELGKEIEDLKTKIIKESSRKDVCENELKKLKTENKAINAKKLTNTLILFVISML